MKEGDHPSLLFESTVDRDLSDQINRLTEWHKMWGAKSETFSFSTDELLLEFIVGSLIRGVSAICGGAIFKSPTIFPLAKLQRQLSSDTGIASLSFSAPVRRI